MQQRRNMQDQQANKQKPKRTEVETQQVVGCKIRVLVGYENKKTLATITTNTSRISIPGMMSMKVSWFKENQLKANFLLKSKIFKLELL